MDIFESLENLNVSEECFDEIMDMVEELLSEDIHSAIDTYAKTDKKGRDALHKKAKANKEKEEDAYYDRIENDHMSGKEPDEKVKKYSDEHSSRNRVEQRETMRWAKKHHMDPKTHPKRYEFATGEFAEKAVKDAAPRGKEVKNEVGEKATKARSAKSLENAEKRDQVVRDIGLSDINPDPNNYHKKFNAFKRSVNDYANSRKNSEKSAEDKSIERHYKKHPVDYGDYESPWA